MKEKKRPLWGLFGSRKESEEVDEEIKSHKEVNEKNEIKDSKDGESEDKSNEEGNDDSLMKNEAETTEEELNMVSKNINENINNEIEDSNVNDEERIESNKESSEEIKEEHIANSDLLAPILDIKNDIKEFNRNSKKNKNEINGLKDQLNDLKKILVEDKGEQIREFKSELIKKENNEIKLLKNLLNIVDEIEHIYEFSVESQNEPLQNNVDNVMKIVRKNLIEIGLEEIPAKIGEKFTPEVHECIGAIVDTTKSENEIVEINKKGYKKDGKVLRSTKVTAVKQK